MNVNEKTINEIMLKMIEFSEGNIHDIDHFIRVWNFARIIGKYEMISEEEQFILEIAALTHDIACPLCRIKYGNTNGKYQETEGILLVDKFLSEFSLTTDINERIKYLVGHHHTFKNINTIELQILIEADYIANASENNYSTVNINNFIEKICKTKTGERLLRQIFL